MRRHASEELVGVMQHYRYRDGTRRLRMARRAHSLLDELPEPRPTPRQETPGDFWRAFATFAVLIVSIYALVIAAGAVALAEAVSG